MPFLPPNQQRQSTEGTTPPEKLDEKLKSENMQKEQQFSTFMLYFESNRGRQVSK